MNPLSATEQMKNWVERVIVKYNFCPFARKEVINNSIDYCELDCDNLDDAVVAVIEKCHQLNQAPELETSLLIFTNGFADFDAFLELMDLADGMLAHMGFEGTYQLAHFHPDYVFADAEEDDPANYTNRAPFPTLHLIREEGMALALEGYNEPESIPEANIRLANRKGLAFWQQLLMRCRTGEH
jgi:hypothetical protein